MIKVIHFFSPSEDQEIHLTVMESHKPGTRTGTEMRLIEVQFQQPLKHESLKTLLFSDARIDLFQVLN